MKAQSFHTEEIIMKTRLLGAVCACIITLIVNTPVISATVFPSEIQACVTSTVCTNPTLVQQAPTFSAYAYSDGGAPKLLLEYNLWPSSNESNNTTSTQLSGTAWLGANFQYDLSQERHFFTLYLDGVTPTPSNIWSGDSDGLDVGLSLITTDLLAGNGFFSVFTDSGLNLISEGNLETHGDIASPGGLGPCLAWTCEAGAQLNLLYLQYSQVGSTANLSINETDPRILLYSQHSGYEEPPLSGNNIFLSQSYYVTPIPSAVWLFASGLLGLIGIARHRQS